MTSAANDPVREWSACPWCGDPDPFAGGGRCRACGREWRVEEQLVEWAGARPAAARSVARLAWHQFHPLKSRLSPLRWLSDLRVEQYYRRTLSDRPTAARWAAHYLRGLHLVPGAAVLDHGCGRGRHVALLQQLGFATAGQDSTRHPWWSRLPAAVLQSVPSDAPRLPWRDASFSAVLDFQVLGHFPEPSLAPFVAEVHRILKPGGYWLVLEANDGGGAARLPRRWYGRLHPLSSVRAVAEAAGFTIVDVGHEGFSSPLCPLLVNFIRKQLSPAPYDMADFDSALAAAVPPGRRDAWLLRAQRPA